MSFHETLKRLRENAHMSQRKLASAIGVTPSTISFWETGRMGPSVESIRELCMALCVSSDVLLELSNQDGSPVPGLSGQEMDYILNFRDLDTYGRDVVASVCKLEADRVKSQTSSAKQAGRSATKTKPRKKSGLKSEKRVSSSGKRHIPFYDSPAAAGISSPVGDAEAQTISVDANVPADADFAVRISGDSMEPVIRNGDIVYVKRTDDLKIKDIGIFSVNGETVCKMYYKSGIGDVTLLSLNPDREDANISIASDSTNTLTCLGLVLGTKSEPPEYFTKKM